MAAPQTSIMMTVSARPMSARMPWMRKKVLSLPRLASSSALFPA
jgi:hypothetical protein